MICHIEYLAYYQLLNVHEDMEMYKNSKIKMYQNSKVDILTIDVEPLHIWSYSIEGSLNK
jgi:hypothetical protein